MPGTQNATSLTTLSPPRRPTVPLEPAINRSRRVEDELEAFLTHEHRSYVPTLSGSSGQIPRPGTDVVAANAVSNAMRQSTTVDEGFEVNSGANRVAYKNEAYMARVNRVRERTEVDPYTGRRVDYYRSMPPEGTTDRRISQDQMAHINPRLRMMQGYDSTSARQHKREVHQAMPEPDNVFGDIVYQDRIRTETEERVMRDVWWNRTGESVPTVRDGGQPFGFVGLNNMLRFEPYMEPTQREGWKNRPVAGHLDNVALTGRQLDRARGALHQQQPENRRRKTDGQRKDGLHGPATASEQRPTIHNQERQSPRTRRDDYQQHNQHYMGALVGPDIASRGYESDRRPPASHETRKPLGLLGHIQAFFGIKSAAPPTVEDRLTKANHKSHRAEFNLLHGTGADTVNAVAATTNKVNMVYRTGKDSARPRTSLDDGGPEFTAVENTEHIKPRQTRSGRPGGERRIFDQGYDQTLFHLDDTRRYVSKQTKSAPQRVDRDWKPELATASDAPEYYHTQSQPARQRGASKRQNVTERADRKAPAIVDYYTTDKIDNQAPIRGRQNVTERIEAGLGPVSTVDYSTTAKMINHGSIRSRRNIMERIEQGLQPVAAVDYYATTKVANAGSIRSRRNATSSVRRHQDYADPTFPHTSSSQVAATHVAKSRKTEGVKGTKGPLDTQFTTNDQVDVAHVAKSRKTEGTKTRKSMGAMAEAAAESHNHPETTVDQKQQKRRQHQLEEGARAREGGEDVISTTRRTSGDQSRKPRKREGQPLKMHYQPGTAEGLGGKRASSLNYTSLTRSDAKRGERDQTYRQNYGHGGVVPDTGDSAVANRPLPSDYPLHDRTTRSRLV